MIYSMHEKNKEFGKRKESKPLQFICCSFGTLYLMRLFCYSCRAIFRQAFVTRCPQYTKDFNCWCNLAIRRFWCYSSPITRQWWWWWWKMMTMAITSFGLVCQICPRSPFVTHRPRSSRVDLSFGMLRIYCWLYSSRGHWQQHRQQENRLCNLIICIQFQHLQQWRPP